jgi:hypothetical protein
MLHASNCDVHGNEIDITLIMVEETIASLSDAAKFAILEPNSLDPNILLPAVSTRLASSYSPVSDSKL